VLTGTRRRRHADADLHGGPDPKVDRQRHDLCGIDPSIKRKRHDFGGIDPSVERKRHDSPFSSRRCGRGGSVIAFDPATEGAGVFGNGIVSLALHAWISVS
jgi:hypothetical protein